MGCPFFMNVPSFLYLLNKMGPKNGRQGSRRLTLSSQCPHDGAQGSVVREVDRLAFSNPLCYWCCSAHSPKALRLSVFQLCTAGQ